MFISQSNEYEIYHQKEKVVAEKEQKRLIEKRTITRDKSVYLKTFVKKIFIVQKGHIDVSIEADETFTAKSQRMFFVELGQRLIISAKEDSTILIFRLPDFVELNEHFPLERLASVKEEIAEIGDISRVLRFNKVISYNVDLICDFIDNEPQYALYFKFKIKEFLFYLSKEYTPYELYRLFADTASTNIRFSDEVKSKVHKYNKMSELAQAMHYTTSGFEKRFKKVFNTSPYQWMKEHKARRLYYDLKMTDKCLKDLADEYGFKSNNYFIEFCIANLGASPAAIRKGKENKTSGT